MRKLRDTAIILLIAVGATLLLWIWPARQTFTSSTLVSASSQAFETSSAFSAPSAERSPVFAPETARPAEVLPEGVLLLPDAAENLGSLHGPESTAELDLEMLQAAIEVFRRVNGGANPEGGLNEEIVDQLRGRNSRRVAVLPPNHPSINESGQLLDRWGTPYFFHPVAKQLLEIRSAGPDRKFWTPDDIANPPVDDPR